MLEYVRGTIEGRGPDWVVIDLRGIGLRVQLPARVLDSLPPPGAETKFWTYLYVHEDVRTIYGFESEADRVLFTQLLGVTGVGPRMALAALSLLPADRLAVAIESGDEATLTRIPGVGKRAASQIALQLKGKVEITSPEHVAVAGDGDALDGLVGMGFTRAEAARALAALPVDGGRSLEETLRLAFQAHLARGNAEAQR